MNRTYLGEFQEIILLIILILEEEAYGLAIQREIKERLNRSANRGALHTALVRLEEKGLIRSEMGGATSKRGGRRKRIYSLSSKGRKVLEEVRNNRQQLWRAVPGMNFNF